MFIQRQNLRSMLPGPDFFYYKYNSVSEFEQQRHKTPASQTPARTDRGLRAHAQQR